ncbi:tetrathionate reductase family octaheme c-type cytochrome [bacterium]|nr:tetrathionate reductase family octaheme c-type cytochrome [bacterium]
MSVRVIKSIRFFLIAAVCAVALVATGQIIRAQDASPWDFVPERTEAAMDHSMVFSELPGDVHAITEMCLGCHGDVADSFMATSHWTWISDEVVLPGGTDPVPYGKINAINNFCVSVPSNWGRCAECHAGYGWKDASFDFSDPNNIDCLVCHDTTGTYIKDPKHAGYPAEDVDLLPVVQNVGKPNRLSCGRCHFNGGGGNGVKHGDMDMTLADCPDTTDVHMGVHDFVCQDCHWTENHEIRGRLPWLNSDKSKSFSCADCHGLAPHPIEKLNDHCDSVACQTCHIPTYAPENPTTMNWDWSTAGLEAAPDERVWDKKKGSFIKATNVVPEYYWWNGGMDPYLPGQELDPSMPVNLNPLLGDITDPEAKIWPFKVHRGKQPYDTQLNHILVPKLFGPDGFWSTWDWNSSLELGAAASGVAYSGEFDYVETEMYWPVNHMVRDRSHSLSCMDCHGQDGLMPWEALGYSGDPMTEGGR